MGAVDVGVRHDDDLVIAQLLRDRTRPSPMLVPSAGDQRADLLGGEHLVEARALDVQDLSAQRQHRLEGAVAPLLGRAAGRIALDDERARRAPDRAPGSRRACPAARPCRARPCGASARAPSAPPRAPPPPRPPCRRSIFASAGCSSNQAPSASLTTPSTTGRTSEETSLSLVCEENFGSGTLTESTQVRPSRQSSPVTRDLLALGDAGDLRVADDLPRQRAAKAGEMRAAVALRDVVGEEQHVLVVGIVPPERRLDGDAVALGAEHDRRRDERLLGAVEEAHEGLEPALVVQLLALLVRAAPVDQHGCARRNSGTPARAAGARASRSRNPSS